MVAKKSLRIIDVEPGSLAEEIGIVPGDRILAVDGREVPDELALQFALSEECVDLHILKASGSSLHLEADLAERTALGIRVEDFRTLTCNNACLFCFVDQLPPGARPGLRIKDDDYRLSFLHGNYITLTNLKDRDLDRIIEHRLSPLYVSVHATDPDLRARILGRRKADDLSGKLHKLIGGGIRVHAQVVLMPGINDGPHLRKTVFDLRALYPGVQSIAVVPLGLSDHGSVKDRFAPVTPDFSRTLIQQVCPWQEQFRKEIRKSFVYLSDELYLQAGTGLPGTELYDDFAQIEDGVGMVRTFLDEFEGGMSTRRKSLPGLNGTLATGRLFYPILADCADKLNAAFGSSLRVREVENRFMGRGVTVAGLLAGGDFLTALQGKDLGKFLIIPQESLSRVSGIFVDDLSPADISKKLGVPVYPGGHTTHDFLGLLWKLNRP